ncbi:MAG: AAA family ATPase [Clostridia bacterium]|nr:AAA family ATPase [Clostridia bacterium]
MTYGLIAEHLGHSFSPEIHRKLFGYEYELKELAPEELASFMMAREFRAVNVTIPYKEAVLPYLDEISNTAKAIGAVNTVVNDGGRLIGYNTDFSGMTALIERSCISLQGKKVLILGSGGTSKTALAVAKSLGCAEALRVSRTGQEDCITYEEATRHMDTQIIINTTPCGMFPKIGTAAVDVAAYPRLEGVVDAVYNPLRSRLVCDAKAAGIPAVGGLYMLVAQAAFAAEKFIGHTAPPEKVEAIYRELLASKQNVVLVGMPGCGKSTVGKALASALGMEFIDTDEEIVRQDGRPIPAIFEAVGEAGFRDIEQRIIHQVAARQHTVIATGGGAILREENVRILRENGILYFIDRPLEQLVATSDRPLSSNRADLEHRYAERYPIYCRVCDAHIRSANAIAETVQTIKEDFNHENFSA